MINKTKQTFGACCGVVLKQHSVLPPKLYRVTLGHIHNLTPNKIAAINWFLSSSRSGWKRGFCRVQGHAELDPHWRGRNTFLLAKNKHCRKRKRRQAAPTCPLWCSRFCRVSHDIQLKHQYSIHLNPFIHRSFARRAKLDWPKSITPFTVNTPPPQ